MTFRTYSPSSSVRQSRSRERSKPYRFRKPPSNHAVHRPSDLDPLGPSRPRPVHAGRAGNTAFLGWLDCLFPCLRHCLLPRLQPAWCNPQFPNFGDHGTERLYFRNDPVLSKLLHRFFDGVSCLATWLLPPATRRVHLGCVTNGCDDHRPRTTLAYGLALGGNQFRGRPRGIRPCGRILLAREAAAHDDLLLLNVELSSTRQLLKESSRVEERLHIARELHDILGHHLAALSIQLEHAMHVASDPVRTDIESAQA